MCTFSTSESQKRLKTLIFWHFWLPNVLRATKAYTFTFSTSERQSGPDPSVFYTFDLETCFAPQRRALFWHLNFQKWSGADVLYTFWLENMLRATTAYTFSTSQIPKVVRTRQFLTLLTWKFASRHNGVQFFTFHLASWLRTRRFSEVTFRPSGAPNHWKNTVNRDSPTFSRTCIFFLLTLSLLWSSHFLTSPSWLFPPLLFHLCVLSEVWLLNFLRLEIINSRKTQTHKLKAGPKPQAILKHCTVSKPQNSRVDRSYMP